jgi:hypothetical protein
VVGMPPNQDSFLKIPNIGKLNKNKPKMDKLMSFVVLFCMVFFIFYFVSNVFLLASLAKVSFFTRYLKMGIKGLSK